MLKKLKSLILDDTVYIALLIVLVGIGSFGLGRISVTKTQSSTAAVPLYGTPLSTTAQTVSTTTPKPESLMLADTTSTVTVAQGSFVASRAGTKYHALTCPGAKTIKEVNKIYFVSIPEAEAAGYTRAANCPLR